MPGRGHARRHAVKPQRDSQEHIKYVIAGVFVLVTLLVLGSALFHSADSNGARVASTHASGEGKEEDAAPRGEGPVFQGEYEGLDIGDLPPGAPLTQESSNTFTIVGHPGERVGQGTKNKYTYVVEVEDTIKPDNIGGFDAFAAMVDATLSNPKSWIADPEISFQHVKEEDLPAGQEPDFRFQLTTMKTTHDVCGNSYNLETSCFMPTGHRVVINEARWLRGAQPYQGDLGGYRQYVINHEVGHGVGYAAHQPCVKNGGLAPVMMQQTLSLSNDELHNINSQEVYKKDGMTCVANPWPYPQGKKTQEDSAANGNRSD
ncbi:DUF3152 domain-containing protein [Corynebacterium sp. 4HC-13]|uniref:DUF3152 domain-containing protein n=2 Tax=Corynebacterium anserum TaxID=2684406 RepID=A0A7G7YR88_9CORY|nr:DUF3152 domain-containing protein [Corynebacterium anserum]QNH97008.1 DUF3152 domain-containing protein [Corynebacterium anserum]